MLHEKLNHRWHDHHHRGHTHHSGPSARNDAYRFGEDNVGVRALDVLANDGGAAKSLVAVVEGKAASVAALLSGDHSSFVSSKTGALVKIGADGKLHYDASVKGAMDFNQLAQGETLTETFTYLMKVGGKYAMATTTVTVVGKNDAPVAAAASADATRGGQIVKGAVVATDVDHGAKLKYALVGAAPAGLKFAADGSWSFDPASATSDVTATYRVTDQFGASSTSTLTIHVAQPGGGNTAPVATPGTGAATEDGAIVRGAVVATDPDAGAVVTYALVNPAPAGLAFSADGSWSFDPSNAAYQHLAQGATQDVVVSYRATDDHGASSTSTLTIRVTGANDAPQAAALEAAATEGAALLRGAVAATDADDGAVLTYSLVGAAPAGLVFNPNGSWSFDPNNAAYQHLAAGAAQDIVVSYRAADQFGASSTSTLTLHVAGANDAPTAVAAGASATEDGAVQHGAVVATDVDDGATLTYALANPAPAGLTFNADGSWSFDPRDAAYQHLAQGAAQDVVATYTATDEHGAASTSTLTIHVTGVNDAPHAAAASAATAEDAPALHGQVAATDADDGASLAYALNGAAPAGLSFNADGAWSFDAGHAAYQHLAAGAAQDVVATYTATDQFGAASTSTLTIHVVGTNDAPVATAATGAATEDGAVQHGSVVATDVDDGAALTYALAGATPAGLLFNADGSWSFDAGHAAYQHLAAGATQDVVASYVATDESGASSTSTITMHVVGVNDAAQISGVDAGVVTKYEAETITGALSVVDVDDGQSVFQAGTFRAAFGDLTLQADGGWSYALDAALAKPLNSGDVAIDAIVVKSLDGTQHTITVTVNGADYVPPVWTGEGDPTDLYQAGPEYPSTNLVGTEGADHLYGTNAGESMQSLNGGDWVLARGGADMISTGDGVDFVYGQQGADVIDAGANDDWIYGGSGADEIQAGDGNDFIYGGYGADLLTGGAGADRFSYYGDVKETGDTIVDFEVGVDKIDLTNFHVAASQITWTERDGDTIVKVDLGGGAEPEFQIQLGGKVALSYNDFYF